MIKKSIAIVLKRFPYSETSLIVRCFVKDLGKVSFIVYGARRKNLLWEPIFNQQTV